MPVVVNFFVVFLL